jgi:hypothetical protein
MRLSLTVQILTLDYDTLNPKSSLDRMLKHGRAAPELVAEAVALTRNASVPNLRTLQGEEDEALSHRWAVS